MDVFRVVKDNVTARQVAEYYGMKIGRNGMACCPFHDDKHPSMKLDKRYYCFGCGEKGDAIDFVGKYFGMTSKDAAMKIADDFGLEYKSEKYKPPQKPLKPKRTLEQEFREAQDYCFKGLSDYLHLLKEWKIKYAPKSMDEEWHPLFCEALNNIDQTEYRLDTLLNGDVRDRAFLVQNQGRKVKSIHERIREFNNRREKCITGGSERKQRAHERERG